MKCQRCGKNEANNHFSRVVNGKKEELHLCSACANEEFTFLPFGGDPFGVNNFLSGLFGGTTADMQTGVQNVCPTCGITFDEICQKSRIGCADCYNVFRSRLANTIKQIHGNAQHTGKIPGRAGSEISRNRRIEKLETELNRAVMKQEFEQAAKIRDKIKELRGE